MAASPWVREAIGQADRDTLVRRAESPAEPPSRQESTEPIGSALPPTVRAELALLTTEQLQAFRHYGLQAIGLLAVTLSTAYALEDPAVDLATVSAVVAALYALLQMVDAELKYQAEREP